MGIFNSFGAMSGQFAAKQERAKVASALAEELRIPGKIAELVTSLQSNGLSDQVSQWCVGESTPANAAQIQQALKNSPLMNDLLKTTNMPVGVVKASLAILLPLTIHQLTIDGHLTSDGKVSDHPLTDVGSLMKALS